MVNRSISSKSFFGALCLSPSPSSPVSVLMILSSSSSSGVVRNVSESLWGSDGAELSAMLAGWEMSDASNGPPLSDVGSVCKRRWETLGKLNNKCLRSLHHSIKWLQSQMVCLIQQISLLVQKKNSHLSLETNMKEYNTDLELQIRRVSAEASISCKHLKNISMCQWKWRLQVYLKSWSLFSRFTGLKIQSIFGPYTHGCWFYLYLI